MTFKLKIVTPHGIYLEKEVDMLNLRTTSGQIGILAKHLPLASAIEISEMNYLIGKERFKYAIGGGFVYVSSDDTTIIANSIESQEEIDLERAKKARERATNRLKSNDPELDILRAEISLKKAINRIKVKEM